MGSRRREGHHRPRRHPPVSLNQALDVRARGSTDGPPCGPAHHQRYSTPADLSSALILSSASQMRVRRRTSAPSPMRVTPRVSSRDASRLGITTRDSTSRLASRVEIRLSQRALDLSPTAKSVFVMSQREVEMHIMESRIAPLIGRLACLSRRLRGRRNTTSNRVQIR